MSYSTDKARLDSRVSQSDSGYLLRRPSSLNYDLHPPFLHPSPADAVRSFSALHIELERCFPDALRAMQPLVAVRAGLMRCMVEGLQRLTWPVDTTTLHEPFTTLAVMSYEYRWHLLRRIADHKEVSLPSHETSVKLLGTSSQTRYVVYGVSSSSWASSCWAR